MRAALLALSVIAAPAAAQYEPVLFKPADLAAMAKQGTGAPLFDTEVARVRRAVDAAMKAPLAVPVPKDPGGGATHEQHRRNYTTIYGAGLLYRLTGEKPYADHVRRLLLEYARLYPTLGPHPAKANEVPGRLFWQSLNDSVWLVYAAQGYDAVRDTLTAADRQLIDDQVFRRMAAFLSDGQAATFDRIHNHATWAAAGVGMTGFVLRERALVDKALRGTDGSGKGGFLAQVDQLFSPDGYYNEGPYYQRYALLPFVLFASAIDANDPSVDIFTRRDAVLVKAIRTAIQLTYNGNFLPLNDAMPDKSLRTDELYQAVAIGYGVTKDRGFLGIAQWQGRTTLTTAGVAVARDVAAGKAKPFPFASTLFRDGAAEDKGAVVLMRDRDQLLVAKNSGMGLGHGHFDKLGWLFYDNARAIITDYGSARFLNVEAKDGGRYLPENETWAKQTVAHNTLVVDERSHFAGKWRDGEKVAPRQIFFNGDGATRVSIAEIAGTYPGVTMRRSLVQVPLTTGGTPIVVDLLRVTGAKPATYDLPLHYAGHITEIGFPIQSNVSARPVLGRANGYQHIWVDATGTPAPGKAALTWIEGGRFYTWRAALPSGANVILGESGANDPRFNLRRQPMLIARASGQANADFVSVLEPHGAYDPGDETVVGSHSRIAALRHARGPDGDAVAIDLKGGGGIVVALADDPAPAKVHRLTLDGREIRWTGPFARLETPNTGMAK